MSPRRFFTLRATAPWRTPQHPPFRCSARARLEGFWSSRTLEQDPAFAAMRKHPEFDMELQESRRLEIDACQVFRQILGHTFVPQVASQSVPTSGKRMPV